MRFRDKGFETPCFATARESPASPADNKPLATISTKALAASPGVNREVPSVKSPHHSSGSVGDAIISNLYCLFMRAEPLVDGISRHQTVQPLTPLFEEGHHPKCCRKIPESGTDWRPSPGGTL